MQAPDLSRTTSGAAHPRGSSVIVMLVVTTFFMENLDGTIIATALPQMARSFGLRTLFGSAIAVFTVASVLCGMTSTLPTFTATRVLQGIGGAMMVPVGQLAVLRTTPKEGLMRAISIIITWPGLVALVIGPPLGGVITTYSSWRWIFYLNAARGDRLDGGASLSRQHPRARQPPVRLSGFRAMRPCLHDPADDSSAATTCLGRLQAG